MRPYNRMNIEFRKQATNEFEKNFYKIHEQLRVRENDGERAEAR